MSLHLTSARLFIAPSTARHHTERILAKLGVATRAAARGRAPAGVHVAPDFPGQRRA